MATWDDVSAAARALPEVEEVGAEPSRSWRVRKKPLVWERPLRKSDLEWLGDAAPTGPILGVRTADLAGREELLAARPDVFFVTPHFDGYPAVLARLELLPVEVLGQILLDAWRRQAPKRLVRSVEG